MTLRTRRTRARRGRLVVALCLAFALTSAGCLTHHVQTREDAASTTELRGHALFWGLMDAEVNVEKTKCPTEALYGVSAKTNWLYALATVATLGIWSPMDFEAHCARDEGEGTI